MNNRYKITISNNNIYKEIELDQECQQLKVGTGIDCDVRLRKELFFGPIELLFMRSGEGWSVLCSDNIYLTAGDVRKLLTKSLVHGDSLEIKYQESDQYVFSLEFFIDFDDGKTRYERVVNIANEASLTIGTSQGNNIVLKSEYVKQDEVILNRKQSKYELNIKQTTYGVYINGKRAKSGDTVCSGDFLSISDYFFYLKGDQLWSQIRSDLGVNGLEYIDHPTQNIYPEFRRNTRVKTVVCDEKIEILDPPAKPQKPKNNLFMRLLPSMGMLLAAGVMAFFGGMMIIMSAISGGMAIFTTIMSIREANKDYKQSSADRIEKYNAYAAKKRAEIQKLRDEERESLEDIYISQQVAESRLETFSSSLFDRMPEDEDYLCVRLGSGDVSSLRVVDYKKQERLDIEDELQSIPQEICEEFKNVHQAPIVCDLKSVNAIGITGSQEYRFEFLKNIVLDITARQYFSNVNLVLVANCEHKEEIRWLRFLPHLYNEDLGIRNLVCDDESRNIVFEYLYKELSIREQNKQYDRNIVVLFYNEYGFKSHPISKFVSKAKELGISFVFFGKTAADIPQGCGYLITIEDHENAVLTNTQNKSETSPFEYTTIPTERAEQIVKLLAPVYTEEISLEGALTKNISMFEMLNILAVDDIELKSRWAKSQVFKSMAAPIGVSKTGVVYLDLHDKAHGPHGLVAGTTGSGKSEILQTYILAMATLFHPYEVAFVIIDFKGGGMVNQFRELPHLLGAITNIDGKEINRSLKSIKAELQKRQRLFAEADVNHIDKYIKKYKAGEVSVPLPHLIIIVDEFAELKAEQPEFMKELISAARIGRSLGVHLILATQKPSGQVNEQIWSNSRFKLCLKVQSQEDSNEVIKSPLAAEIKEPGRAYLQVGNNEIFELFQSAYSGASEKTDDSKVKEFTIYSLTESGKKVPVFSQKKQKSGEGSATQLDAIVKYVSDYCKKISLRKLPEICLPSLKECIDFETSGRDGLENGTYEVEIGIYDDPDNQYQGVHTVDLGSNNLMMIGSAQSGKTNVLQDIIRSLSTKYTPDEVNIYIIDFASMVLKNFERLNHVGGVVCPSEDEKLKNLFKLLHGEIESRKERLMSVGVSSFAAYKEAGQKEMPLIVLLIDNLTALKELYFQDDDELLNLCREGLTVGISIVIANSQTAGIGYKYLSNFSARMALYCNDSNEYSSLFDHCSERIDSIPGRCLVEIDKGHFECQSYLAFKGEKEIDRVQEIKQYIASVNMVHCQKAKRIPLIPTSLTKEYMVEQLGNYMEKRFSIVAGLDYATVTPCVLDLSAVGLLAVAGREGAGRHNWMKYTVDMLDTMYPGMSKVYVVDGIGKKLVSLKSGDNVTAYSIIAEDAVQYIKEMEQQLKERYEALVAGNENALNDVPLLMLLVDNQDALMAICNNPDALAAYKNIVGRYKNMKACIVALVENQNIPYSAPEILKNIRDQRNFMYFDDMSNMKIFDVPLVMSRNFKKPIELGDGYYIKNNECIKLKTALNVKNRKDNRG
ncbi:type VII secretion protein EssC [Pseudoflavonifractor capillosus]|uniref:type VII secretion protein EssC n=1 Tax=Pseudoflavonifractor capillosus TaxID=106588 RepID=UPI00195A54CF|nr:type VII secretion protein EssC [Pseudoflavonifractor capillosus]MBM6694902.1 type VII secretion protein EssC [Pseudoflavonifractor capillosus]